jgi:histidine triad (HIT) family protein
MFNHAPRNYVCPFCRNIRSGDSDLPLEILHRDANVFVKMNPKWRPRNRGAALVIPVDHHENVFDLPAHLGTPLQAAVRDTAIAMKTALGCSGVSTRQHNEPDGDQDVWHYHVHVFPRYEEDGLDAADGELASRDEIHAMANLLRSAWPSPGSPDRSER